MRDAEAVSKAERRPSINEVHSLRPTRGALTFDAESADDGLQRVEGFS